MRSLIITRPDDWHVHFRDGDALQDTVNATARHFARALAMPNLTPALITPEALQAYRLRLLDAVDKQHAFTPYMTFYLNERMHPDTLAQAHDDPYLLGAKLYPAGATTNSAEGVQSIRALYPHFETMQNRGLVLQIHGEVTKGDVFARERIFIEQYLKPLTQNFPNLHIVLEHISTKAAVEFIESASENVAATITPHHLLFNRNHLLAGGIRPHYYCLPILKKESDQKAVQQAAISGNPKFFAGTDSAPHARTNKESSCGCAGIYTAPFAVTLYAQFFAELNQLTRLNAFMSQFGATFYGLPITGERIELIEKPQIIPERFSFGKEEVIPALAGETLKWSVRNDF